MCILSFWRSSPSIFTCTHFSTFSYLGLKPQVAHQSIVKATLQNGIAQMEETKWCVFLYTKDDKCVCKKWLQPTHSLHNGHAIKMHIISLEAERSCKLGHGNNTIPPPSFILADWDYIIVICFSWMTTFLNILKYFWFNST